MALKAELESISELPEPVAQAYKEVERGGKKVFVLDIEGELPEEVTGPLKRARDHEKSARQKAEAAAKEKADALQKLQDEIDAIRSGAIPKSDFESLKKSLEERTQKQVAELSGKLSAKDAAIHRYLVGNTARDLAAKLAGDNAAVLLPHIERRLAVTEENGEPVTAVLGPDGKPSVMTMEELEKEFRGNRLFAPVIIGSKATGAGASGSTGTPGGRDWTKVDPSKLRGKELAQWAAAQEAGQK